MKKTLLLAAALSAFSLTAQAEKLQVAATPVPHAEILEFVKPALAEQGITLEVKVFTDYVQPNVQVSEGRLDANFFQHQPYLDEFNAAKGTKLVSVAGIHIEPFGAYSRKVTSLADLKQGAQVAIPNDATNGGRALLLLQNAGVLTLKADAGITASPRDIADNPKKLRVRELEAATVPRVLDQVDVALINTNYALEAGLNPQKDALAIEGADSPYVNILVTREDNQQAEAVQKLVQALGSDAVRDFINEKYNGAVIPVF
ncbi:MetQ/NlpA family ABC transporter substrate-binding protein [Thiopseudomonas denitrificans]|uniref:D-methionine transport system substrate-binding protein n=1 Tax=Thiopseudomonas denitrificans TaxID=1501432 RepID=A0A4R6U5D5_9GAMM|nr:MetQ/NlpA family ABC transporter substrate-binding protein [Thiopseudomonas denitrificans]TDQ38244.1 D-methionine transport system substrate-binding protein [Thiopseudomonas denitrificans]